MNAKDMVNMEYVEIGVWLIAGIMSSFSIAWIICTIY